MPGAGGINKFGFLEQLLEGLAKKEPDKSKAAPHRWKNIDKDIEKLGHYEEGGRWFDGESMGGKRFRLT